MRWFLDGDRIYLFNKLNVLVTSFVRSHLETDNTRVAIVQNGRIIGLRPGKTNVRVRVKMFIEIFERAFQCLDLFSRE